MFKQITILAPGLLGASLGAAVRERQLSESVAVWARRAETRERCRPLAWCDHVYEHVADAASGADLVVICAPVDAIPGLALEAAAAMPAGGLLTDVGSTKRELCDAVLAHLPKAVDFVGSHPMAGSEKSGLEFADANLFRGRCCLVTPDDRNRGDAVERTVDFWRAVGMTVYRLDPGEHDRVVAELSHLPHVLASLLAAHLDDKDPTWRAFAGTGLKDTTRIAAGNPAMWMDILRHNRAAIAESLVGYRQQLEHFERLLSEGRDDEIAAVLEAGQRFRQQLDQSDELP